MRIGIAIAMIVAGLLMALAINLMVLPGYYLFLAADLPFGRFFGPFHGDHWLPVAMQMQLFWAPALPASLWAAHKIIPASWAATRGRRWPAVLLLAAAFAFVWAVALSMLLHWQAVGVIVE